MYVLYFRYLNQPSTIGYDKKNQIEIREEIISAGN